MKAYSNKILDPKSKAVDWLDNYFVCKRIKDEWHIIESAWSDFSAFKARDILAEHDVKNGHAANDDWRVFKREHIEIVENK